MPGENIFDRDQKKIHLNLAKIKKNGTNFEIDIEPDLAIQFKEGKAIDIKDIVKAQKIFADVKKGLLSSEETLKEIFGTDDALKVAEIIIKEGEIQLTHEHREKVREEKRKRVITLIHTNAIDPKTGLPHPVNRIEAAIEEAKVKIDELKTAEAQIDDIMHKLRPIIPIKFDKKKIELEIKSQYAQQCLGILKNMGKVEKQNWDNEGSLFCVVEIPAGLSEDFFDKLNSMTHGTIISKMVN